MPFFGLMRVSARALGRLPALLAACSVCCTWALLASAGPMDPTLARLVVDPSCQADRAEVACVPDRAAYTKLVSQLGAALAPHAAHGARTTGLAGFDVSLLASLTSIDASADYWQRGTLGRDSAGARNDDPERYLQLYSLELRKGFGFGIEAAASLGVMPHTRLLAWGADLRVALLEGMRDGAWRYLPDTSLGASLRQATGLGELGLGTLALEGRLSYPLPSPLGVVVTPWLGYQWLRIAGSSSAVDVTPREGALEACQYVGNGVPGTPGSAEAMAALPASGAPEGVLDGSPLCRGNGFDLANVAWFGDARVYRHRVLVGASVRRELLRLSAQLETDLLRPDAAQSDAEVSRALRCDVAGENCRPSPRQWTLVLALGASF